MDAFGSKEVIKHNHKIDRINTGLSRLDELLNGGIPRKSITLISGTPGSGKQ